MTSKGRTPEQLAAIARGNHLAEEDLRLLVARVRDYAIIMLDPHGHITSWNEGAERIKGYAAAEIIGQHMSVFYLPNEAKSRHPQELLEQAKAEGRVEDEGWRVRKDGSHFWADVIITALRDDRGKLRGFAKVTRDLTERRNARIILGDLSGRLLQLQDDERRRIARELHDTTSPLLTGLTGKLYVAKSQARTKSPEVMQLIDEALSLAEATATMVRTVASMLHPALLDQAGLLPALRWYLDALTSRTAVHVTIDLPDALPRLNKDDEVAVFRSVQEWTNGAVSAGAGALTVKLRVGERVELSIASTGIRPSVGLRDRSSPLFVTMAAIRSRLQQLHGDLKYVANTQETSIAATLPVRKQQGVG